MALTFRLPEINDEEILKKYVDEHHINGETSVSNDHPNQNIVALGQG